PSAEKLAGRSIGVRTAGHGLRTTDASRRSEVHKEYVVISAFRSLRPLVIATGMVAGLAPLMAGARQPAPPPALNIPFEKYALSNGLTVVLAEGSGRGD